MNKRALIATSVLAFILGTQSSFATKFGNQFTEFELPPQWSCQLEGAEWVCQSTDEKKKRDAIIVLAAKIKGDQDSMDQYKTYLLASKSYKSIQGKLIKSEAKYAKLIPINGQEWVDALQLDSEIPGFYTRYLATVKEDIGVLVTYSINKSKYTEYLGDFETMVRTLKVFRKPGAFNQNTGSGSIFEQGRPPTTITDGTVFPGGFQPRPGNDQPIPKPQPPGNSTPLLLLIGGAIAFIIWRRRRTGN